MSAVLAIIAEEIKEIFGTSLTGHWPSVTVFGVTIQFELSLDYENKIERMLSMLNMESVKKALNPKRN